MVHNRQNRLGTRSLSGREDSDNINLQEFIEILGGVLNFHSVGGGEGGERIRASCTQI